MNACLHDTCYDAQCESSRADYLWEVIQLTQDLSFFEDKILKEISVADDDCLICQLLSLARFMAKNGNNSARGVLYEYMKNAGDDVIYSCAEEIILLDGLDGLIFVAGVLGERLLNREGEGLWEDEDLINLVKERYGDKETTRVLEEAAAKDIRVKKYLEAVETHSQWLSSRERKPIDYSEIKEKIDGLTQGKKLSQVRGSLRVWGKNATTAELTSIATDLLKETDEKKLTGYLQIFAWREFPLNYIKLLDLALSQNQELAQAAINSLKHIQNPSIHDLAISLIQNQLFYPQALELLVKNYQNNDYQLIEQIINQKLGSDEFHSIAYSIIKIFQENPTPDSINTMLKIYQKAECSHCREKCVKIMITTQTIPNNIIKECHHDANPDIRKLVNHNLKIA